MPIDPLECRVLCPYYVRHSKPKNKKTDRLFTITCQPLVSLARMGFVYDEQICFRDARERRDYMECMCCGRYEDCPHYAATYQNELKEERKHEQKAKEKEKGLDHALGTHGKKRAGKIQGRAWKPEAQ